MNPKQVSIVIWLSLFTASLSGCTTQSWYEGAKLGAENSCRNQPQAESDRCLENLNKKSYEEYEKERSGKK